MRFHSVSILSSIFATTLALTMGVGCSGAPSDGAVAATSEELRGPGGSATDQHKVELGNDLSILKQSKISLADGIDQASAIGPVIEAKFELDDNQKLSLSIYPLGAQGAFQELSGDPTVSPFAGALAVFQDQEHITRSARDLTLTQLSRLTLADAVRRGSGSGSVFWAIPTIRYARAGYGVYAMRGTEARYRFIDGGGSYACTRYNPTDLGTGPGSAATDTRVPELGADVSIVRTSKISMADALARAEASFGDLIEAKFELGDDGKLSLSIYPVGKGIKLDSERNTFFEAAGDPTATTFAPTLSEFKVPDVEHLTTASRDLTLVQTAGLTLRDAVHAAEEAMAGGVVYWAIPTIRDTRAGYGVYVLGADGASHYFFIS